MPLPCEGMDAAHTGPNGSVQARLPLCSRPPEFITCGWSTSCRKLLLPAGRADPAAALSLLPAAAWQQKIISRLPPTEAQHVGRQTKNRSAHPAPPRHSQAVAAGEADAAEDDERDEQHNDNDDDLHLHALPPHLVAQLPPGLVELVRLQAPGGCRAPSACEVYSIP